MKCPICGKDLELKNKQIGTSENGEPIFNKYAICRDCRKQWNLDKQRAKRQAAKKVDKPVAAVEAEKAAAQKPSVKKTVEAKTATEITKPADNLKDTKAAPVQKKVPAKKNVPDLPGTPRHKHRPDDATASSNEVPAKKAVKKRSAQVKEIDESEKRYSNIPSEKVRSKREKAVRQGYEDMLATGTIKQSDSRKKKRSIDETKSIAVQPSEKNKPEIPDYDDDDSYDEKPRFRAMRILMGIISLIGFGYFIYRGFNAGLAALSAENIDSGMIFVILALCMLVSALLYFIMQKTNTIFAFLLPMVFYLGSGVFAFLKRGDDMQLLIAAVACAVLAVISLILAITSRGGDDYDDEDAFDDDYDDDYDE